MVVLFLLQMNWGMRTAWHKRTSRSLTNLRLLQAIVHNKSPIVSVIDLLRARGITCIRFPYLEYPFSNQA